MTRVKIEDGYIVLDGHYDIKLNRCDTKAKILDWVCHLSEKTWVTKKTITDFIDAACSAHGINPRCDA